MRLSPLGPSKRAYAGLIIFCLVGAALAQRWTERGRRQALGPPKRELQMVELWPVLLGGFRGPMIAALAYYAQELEVEADIYGTRSSIRTYIKLQPEFEHLWIYYSWVIAYNLTAVISPPQERYQFIRDGIAFLKEGIETISKLYEGRKPYVNDRCPVTGQPIDADQVGNNERLIRKFEGVRVAFADELAATTWDSYSELEKAIRLEAVRDAPYEYKRKRATLLYMLGWTYYNKLANDPQGEAKRYYRNWYIRDTGRDPFQEAYYYLARASAVDVPPYQVSYHVLKTSPCHCLVDWARALADDKRVRIDDVVYAFERARKAWDKALPKIPYKKPLKAGLHELEVVTKAMRQMKNAEDAARVGDDKRAYAFLAQARRLLTNLYDEQPLLAYKDVYQNRYNITREHVGALLAGRAL